MSRSLRIGFAAFFLVGGFATPAAANAFTDLFSLNPAPDPTPAAAAPAPAQDDCLSRPGEQTAGQHWVYRYDGHRKCWFQAADDTAKARKPARHRVAKQSAAAPEQDKSAPPEQKEEVTDAHAEMVSSAPAEVPQPTPSTPHLTMVKVVKVADAAPPTEAAAQVPPAPVLEKPPVDQLTAERLRSHHVDVETLLADAPAASGEVASQEVASQYAAAPVAARGVETDGGGGWMPTWLGALLMVLGGAALLSSSPTLWQALLAARSPDPEPDYPDYDEETATPAPVGSSITEYRHYRW